MSNYEVIMSRQALITFKSNIKFLRKFSIPYSKKIESKIDSSIKKLKSFPNIHPIFKKTNKNVYRKIIIEKRYLVVYTVKQQKVLVYYILDGRQAYNKYFKSLK